MADVGLPDGWITLRCPPGAESAPIAFGATAYRSYRERIDNDVWLVNVPQAAAVHFCQKGGFWPHEANKA